MLWYLGLAVMFVLLNILFIFLVLFALGAMHNHLINKGLSFGYDAELHAKIDTLMEQHNNAAFTTKH